MGMGVIHSQQAGSHCGFEKFSPLRGPLRFRIKFFKICILATIHQRQQHGLSVRWVGGSLRPRARAVEDARTAVHEGGLSSNQGWPLYVRLESLIERWGSRQLFLSRKLHGKIDVFAEELPRKSSPGQKFTTRKRGNRRITARNT